MFVGVYVGSPVVGSSSSGTDSFDYKYNSFAAIEKTSSTLSPVLALVSKNLSILYYLQNSNALSLVTSRSSSRSHLLPIKYIIISLFACYLISLSQSMTFTNVSSLVISYVRKTQCAPL